MNNEICEKYSCVGSKCVEPQGHTGTHRSEYGSTWTDESDAAFANQIAKSMEGRRD